MGAREEPRVTDDTFSIYHGARRFQLSTLGVITNPSTNITAIGNEATITSATPPTLTVSAAGSGTGYGLIRIKAIQLMLNLA